MMLCKETYENVKTHQVYVRVQEIITTTPQNSTVSLYIGHLQTLSSPCRPLSSPISPLLPQSHPSLSLSLSLSPSANSLYAKPINVSILFSLIRHLL